MVQVARSDCEHPLGPLRDTWRGCFPRKPQDSNLSEICGLIYLWQVFSPGKVIFAGIGILLLVRILLYTSAPPIERLHLVGS